MFKTILCAVLFAVCATASADQYFKVQHWSDTDLYRDYSRLSGLTTDFCTDAPARVQTSGYIGLVHRGLVVGPVGWAVRISYRTAPTLADLGPQIYGASPGGYVGSNWIPGAKSAGNISSIEHHYAEANLASAMDVAAGCYRLEVWGNSHSSSAPYTDGLIEVNGYPSATSDTYGYMATRVAPRAVP